MQLFELKCSQDTRFVLARTDAHSVMGVMSELEQLHESLDATTGITTILSCSREAGGGRKSSSEPQ
jgi:hypothetical protein